jgi:hypothetical protein
MMAGLSNMNDLARAMVRQNVMAGNYGGGDPATLRSVAGLPPVQTPTPGALTVQPAPPLLKPDDDEQKRKAQAAQSNASILGGPTQSSQPTSDRLGG